MADIKITVKGAETIPLNLLEDFQKDLKSLEQSQYEKLRDLIKKLGFSFAVHVWKNQGKAFIIDGHQRVATVRRMVKEEGYACPPIPVNVVDARDFQEAKRKVAAAASQYGRVNQQGLFEFMKEAGIGIEELKASFDFPEINFGTFETGFFGKPEQKNAEGAKDLTDLGESKMLHKCPKCGFEFGTVK